ncbi:AbiJ-related protein [Streptomyces griseoruber]|uniref:AbiJ-related protein n=1 Tax=Streptomyces griseoruber TaxID=1943 RepID=UPI0037ADD11D
MDVASLRRLIDETVVSRYEFFRHDDIPALCESLSMPVPPPRTDPRTGQDVSKHKRLTASLSACRDEDLPAIAHAVLASQPVTAAHRNALQDVLWQGSSCVEIPGRTRRELAASLRLEVHVQHPDSFLKMLDALWVLDDDPLSGWGGPDKSLRAQVTRHVIRNDDWDTEYLFEQLGCFDAPHPRFARFLEALAAPSTIPDEPAQRHFVEIANEHLQRVGTQLQIVGEQDGYPVFELIKVGETPSRRPRQVIFATLVKPDIRVSSVLDGDLEVIEQAERADEVLIYDRVIGNDGLRWRDLVAWWQEKHGVADTGHARSTLFDRMRASLPKESTGQDNLYWLYYNIYQHEPDNLPALLPEVWLHWDHQTIQQRRERAQQHIRMDFLLLMPGRKRVVLEVDGSQHFTENRGTVPSPRKYAETMAGDRELKLLGYHVYRFGHDELEELERARPVLTDFFGRLLRSA